MNGIDLVRLERERQQDKGYTGEHDLHHDHGELANAAAAYLENYRQRNSGMHFPPIPREWPFLDSDWHPDEDQIHQLAKVGALVVAEIDRLLAAKS